jgi:hypothetical protein
LRVGILDLLGAPASILGLAHVAWGLDGGDKLKGNVGETDDTDAATSNLAEDMVTQEKTAEEDVDLKIVSIGRGWLFQKWTYKHHGRRRRT